CASVVFNCTKRQAEFHLGLACEPHASEIVDFESSSRSRTSGQADSTIASLAASSRSASHA
ncbi:hypothetical protein, partial [Streptomyces sp. NPDC017964]|uniref:hypothetical protein n=1 Tax=Streptomyces sp. NPDC017964 TaxID=3365022 RepID=UPI00379C9142